MSPMIPEMINFCKYLALLVTFAGTGVVYFTSGHIILVMTASVYHGVKGSSRSTGYK